MKRPFHTFTNEDHEAWRLLVERQLPNLQKHGSQQWLNGWRTLEMPANHVPDFTKVSKKLKKLTQWELMSTPLGYSDGQSWFETLQRNEFMVTEYIRPKTSLDFTPLPDVFHDTFGHIPFLVDPQFSRIVRMFTKAILKANPTDRTILGHWWWFTVEFGLIKEHGQIKILGAGIASSFGEVAQVFSGKTKLTPFDPKIVGQKKENPSGFHQELFVLESLDQLEEVIKQKGLN